MKPNPRTIRELPVRNCRGTSRGSIKDPQRTKIYEKSNHDETGGMQSSRIFHLNIINIKYI
jgi:hypothetical protein